MSRPTQTKAQNEANTRALRALVKQPENKACVDCKRNDPRWASWNIGCFLCIRCSGIHRSMGTHISKVKSIDLDIWTPEQMASVQKWGNKRANAYWEAHLKPGHVPPEHKIESFIRSKYETRRWAKEGPPPTDPSVLDEGGAAAPVAAATSPTTSAAPARAAAAVDLLSDPTPASANPTSVAAPPRAPSSSTTTTAAPAAAAAAAAPKATGGGGGLFDLDWNDAPSSSSTNGAISPTLGAGGARGKNDILSLFAAPRPAVASPPAASAHAQGGAGAQGGFGGLDAFGGLSMGNGSAPAPAAAVGQQGGANPWAAATQQTSAGQGAGGFDVWGDMTGSGNKTVAPQQQQQQAQKNDAFADIWGDFK